MSLYKSRPQYVEAIHHEGDFTALEEFAPGKVTIDPATGLLMLLAGKDGAQDWVPVPLGHWLVHQPDDLSDIWPVDPDYFAAKYDLPDQVPHG
jgi:hypothetical protein